MKPSTASRVREELSLFYHCPAERFSHPGTLLRPLEALSGTTKAYLMQIGSFSVLTLSPEDHRRIGSLCPPDGVLGGVEDLRRFWPNPKRHERYRCLILDQIEGPLPEPPEGYRLVDHDPENRPPLQAFLDRCTPDDIDAALIDLDDPDDAVVLAMAADETAAYAGYRIFQKDMGDVGILVRPEHRRKGLGYAATAQAAAICLERGYLPMYRHLDTNAGSGAIADAVGFVPTWTVDVCGIG